MTMADPTIWTIILALGAGTFALRFSFLGLLGDRELPVWAARLLRYTATSVFPAIIAPLVIFPAAEGGAFDPPRFFAALTALTLAVTTRNVLAALAGGAASLYLLLWLLG